MGNELQIAGARSGFYCIDGNKQLVAFHMSQEYVNHGEHALDYIINEHKVSAALAGTNDSFFLSLCLDIATGEQVHTLLFQDNRKIPVELNEFNHCQFKLATDADFTDVFEHYCATSGSLDTESVEAGFEDLKGYTQSLMAEHQIFVLREQGELMATSECRISKTQKPYADLGMIVAEKHRRKGVASYILTRTKEFCYERNTIPICSCEADNVGSKKAILNAGFSSKDRIIPRRSARRS